MRKKQHDGAAKRIKKRKQFSEIGKKQADEKRNSLKTAKKNWKRTVLSSLDLPQETQTDVPKLTMVGRGDLLVENHCGVLQYTCETVRLHTDLGILCITGTNLELLELGVERAYVKGILQGVGYES